MIVEVSKPPFWDATHCKRAMRAHSTSLVGASYSERTRTRTVLLLSSCLGSSKGGVSGSSNTTQGVPKCTAQLQRRRVSSWPECATRRVISRARHPRYLHYYELRPVLCTIHPQVWSRPPLPLCLGLNFVARCRQAMHAIIVVASREAALTFY